MKKILGISVSSAFAFVFTMGIVNLFADMTYEGAGAINGPFLGSLGAGAAAISIVAGVGEFLGYGLRLISGYISDKTGRYWLMTIIGYAINLLAVPAMALARDWPTAAALVMAERVGRGLRKPTVEAMLSYTTDELGRGWVYALNTALDEIGATLGPLMMASVLIFGRNHRFGYATLLIPAILALVTVFIARIIFPLPANFSTGRSKMPTGFTRSFKLYMIASAFFAAGLMSYELISFHFSHSGAVREQWIPIFVAFATVVGIIASLAFGKIFDKVGMPIVFLAVLLSCLFAPLVFFGHFTAALIGIGFWGIGYATQDTLLKAVVASVLPEGKRSLAFGLFYAIYGTGWLVGSIATGLLYEHSKLALVLFAMASQLASIPFFIAGSRADLANR